MGLLLALLSLFSAARDAIPGPSILGYSAHVFSLRSNFPVGTLYGVLPAMARMVRLVVLSGFLRIYYTFMPVLYPETGNIRSTILGTPYIELLPPHALLATPVERATSHGAAIC